MKGDKSEMKIEYCFEGDEAIRCKGAKNTEKDQMYGVYYGYFYCRGQQWAIVLWDGDDDPDLYKASCILIEKKTWVKID